MNVVRTLSVSSARHCSMRRCRRRHYWGRSSILRGHVSLKTLIFGQPLASHEEGEQRVGWVAGIPMLGLDALGSAAYGPEAALTLLIPLGALGSATSGRSARVIIALLLIVYFSYRQTIAAYPPAAEVVHGRQGEPGRRSRACSRPRR